MTNYDYRSAVCDDIRAELECRGIMVSSDNRDRIFSELYDDLFVSDSVTGNASGSYTFNAWQAEEYLCHNMDLLANALNEFGCEESDALTKGAEWCDVTIRCYILGECLNTVLDELVDEFEAELFKADKWWEIASEVTKEAASGFFLIDFEDSSLFYDEVEDWWDGLDDEDKGAEYHKHC